MNSRSMRKHWPSLPTVAAIILVCLYAPNRCFGQQPAHSTTSSVGVIPDSHGAIAEILLYYDPDISSELEPLYRDLFSALPADVRVRVLCPDTFAVAGFIRSWDPVLCDRAVDVVNVGLPMSIWARDRCIARQSLDLRNTAATFVPVSIWEYEPEKNNDLLLQDILHEARLGPEVMDSPLHIEGGNVVSNRRHVFLGANVLWDNGELTYSRLQLELNRLLGREFLAMGDKAGEVPWCHIDMYLTPLGDDTVLVASPRLATNILSAGDDCDDGGDYWDDLPGTACPSDSLQEQFDSVAVLAEQHGYRVYRIPAIANVVDQWMVTYNNILLDERDGRRVVYMPVYAIPPLDQVAAAFYRGLGLEVRTVNVSELYRRGGALRCVANITRRRRPASVPEQTAAHGRIRLVNLAGARAFDGILDRCRHRLASRSQRNPWSSESQP